MTQTARPSPPSAIIEPGNAWQPGRLNAPRHLIDWTRIVTNLFILFALALIVSSIGFKNFIWFISLGYGFSVAAIGVAIMVLFWHQLTPATVIMCCLFIVYGCRLGLYLLVREVKSASYKKTLKGEIKDGSTMSFGVKVAIWVTCALLYVCETSPVLFRLGNGGSDDVCSIVGLVLMVCGIALEAAADATKSRFKRQHPRRFCDVGLFRLVRCPNYLGEVITWTGAFVSGITIYSGPLQWVVALAGYVCIVYIMFGGARRLEIRQNKNYGADPEYQAYVKSVPILIPFIPLYSVEKYKWLVS